MLHTYGTGYSNLYLSHIYLPNPQLSSAQFSSVQLTSVQLKTNQSLEQKTRPCCIMIALLKYEKEGYKYNIINPRLYSNMFFVYLIWDSFGLI